MGRKHPYSFVTRKGRHTAPEQVVFASIPLKTYCEQRMITRDQARTLVRKRWVIASKVRGRIYVYELCPEEVSAWLGMTC
jgi:hypothetical protein